MANTIQQKLTWRLKRTIHFKKFLIHNNIWEDDRNITRQKVDWWIIYVRIWKFWVSRAFERMRLEIELGGGGGDLNEHCIYFFYFVSQKIFFHNFKLNTITFLIFVGGWATIIWNTSLIHSLSTFPICTDCKYFFFHTLFNVSVENIISYIFALYNSN